MKIAYLANVRFPSERAHAVQIAHMCQAFVANGCDLELFVSNRKTTENQSFVKYFGFVPSFKITRLRNGFFNHKILLTYYLCDVLFVFNFLLFHYQNKFDVIYSRNEWHIFYLSFFVDLKKLVWESHEAKFNFPARALLKKKIKTVVISEGIYNDYVAQGISQSKLLVAHDGIDESFFDIIESKKESRRRLGLPLEKKIAMYIGGFEPWKGVEIFFAAAKQTPDVMFVAVGGREDEVSVYRIKYPEVTFLGQLPYAELRNNQQAADVLVIPNSGKSDVSAKYTSPLKLFAHMASGVPIVASDVTSIVSVTERNLVSLAVPDNTESFAEVIHKVFEQYKQKCLQAQDLKMFSSRYTWRVRARGVLNFFSK